jgi:hypothetical protein
MSSTLARNGLAICFAAAMILSLTRAGSANTRTLEFQFALSSQINSEFSASFRVSSPGKIIVEAIWTAPGSVSPAVPLELILTLPDGRSVRNNGRSPLRLEHQATESEIERFTQSRARWSVKIINSEDAQENRKETNGRLRITVPVVTRTLEDTQFTLQGYGNAQEIPFVVPAPGRVVVEADWQTDPLSTNEPSQSLLMLSLLHPGQSKTYAQRRGKSSLRIEHQVTEQEMDRGIRWIAKVLNESRAKVTGRLKVLYTPGQ